MKKRRIWLILYVVLIYGIVFSGCGFNIGGGGGGSDLPDLVVLPGPHLPQYCDTTYDIEHNTHTLIVHLKNQSDVKITKETTLAVDFGEYGIKTVTVAPFNASEERSVEVLMPKCFNPDCGFVIRADDNNDIQETDENNNIAKSLCGG